MKSTYIYTASIKWYSSYSDIKAFNKCFDILNSKGDESGYSYSFLRIEETGYEDVRFNNEDLDLYCVRTLSIDPKSLEKY